MQSRVSRARLIIAVAITACWHRPYSSAGGLRRDVGFTRKVVAGKEDPSTLLAQDGTRCLVTTERFAQVKQGEQIWCDWREPTFKPLTTSATAERYSSGRHQTSS